MDRGFGVRVHSGIGADGRNYSVAQGSAARWNQEKADFGDHLLEISHRDTNGRAELHQTKADVIVIQTGTATLVTGGEVIDPTPTGPNEIQGSSIRGGVKHEVGPGDVIEIPAGVPHQFFLAPGTQITYLVVKVIKK
jgi:hypothetical protein